MTTPLPEPATPEGRAGLGAVSDAVQAGSGALVALDFDGTLAPVVPRPEDSRLADGALDALTDLGRRGTRLALVTGRPAADAVELGGLHAVPGLLVLGQYGVERWSGGRLDRPEPPPGVDEVRRLLPDLLDGADPGVWVEDKRGALVVHTRRASDPVYEAARLREPLTRLAGAHGLEAHPGRYVVELRPAGADKGGAVDALVAELAPVAVLFAGDDLGDLPAFAAVRRWRADGLPGVTVCSRSDEAPEVAEQADLVVDGPAGVVALLAALARPGG